MSSEQPFKKVQPIVDERGRHDQVIAISFKGLYQLARLPVEVQVIESLHRGRRRNNPWFPDGDDDEFDHVTLFLRITSKYAQIRPPRGALFIEEIGGFIERHERMTAEEPPAPPHRHHGV